MNKSKLVFAVQWLERNRRLPGFLEKMLSDSVYSTRYIVESNGYMTGVRITFEFWDDCDIYTLLVDTEDRLLFDAMGSRSISVPISPGLAAFFKDYAINHIGFDPHSGPDEPFPEETDRHSWLFL